MEGCSKNGDQGRPQLLDLISKERREWHLMRNGEGSSSLSSSSEEKKLELRLGPPGCEHSSWAFKDSTNNLRDHHHHSLLSLGYLSSMNNSNNNNNNNNGFSFIHQQSPRSLPAVAKESSQPCALDLQSTADKKAFSSSPVPAKNTAVSQKRTAPAPVVGWPPIRSFRKNLASTSASTKAASHHDCPNRTPTEAIRSINEQAAHAYEPGRKSPFVKVNMDGVPIGRKVDLHAYDSYEKLSAAVDELFRGLLAGAQRDFSAGGIIVSKKEEEKAITDVLDGSGEYTLVYEDNEGDRMLVGDVPWHMFVSTVKRLRVLKSSEVSALSLVSNKEDKPHLNPLR